LKDRLVALDIFRVFAAVSVVFFHYFFGAVINGSVSYSHLPTVLQAVSSYGYLGVQFFFMISGFVIAMSIKDRGAVDFVLARFYRLFPAYWVCVLITASVILLVPTGLFHFNTNYFLLNLTMLQRFFDIPHLDKSYWSLTYEVIFYFWVFTFFVFRVQDKIVIAFFPFL
jgi:peptidoglycan/LPS O-acetylase OafA/YrhL